ncbi:MAG: 4-alpha-glucanotransferase, partial [Candidatus Hydrogenedentes bacterium]|nr:4-alpha-glucanotransferase [Candidatus Hydrogenedentota bacterium]
DIPIYVAHDSSDVWSHPDLFHLDEKGLPTVVAGVPPDYFSATGQYWGNPIYRWDVMASRQYTWWTDRIRMMLSMVDILRIDHFRGFEAYWAIPAKEETAVNGHWETGPRDDLFHAIMNPLGKLPLVAENLGLITPEVEELRKRFEFPGMGVLQFAFGPDIDHAGFLPHEYYPNMVAYTGTHDNDTFIGWWNAGGKDTTMSKTDIKKERNFARKYMAASGKDINWVGIRVIMSSVADTAVFPLQDILGLGSETRMNTPGTSGNHNWRWRFTGETLTPNLGDRLREMTEIYGRLPKRG